MGNALITPRTIRWTAAIGATVGVLLAYRVITDLTNAVAEGGAGIPGIAHIILCWPLLLTPLFPANTPHFIFYAALALLNAATFTSLIFLITNIAHAILSRDGATPEANNGQ